MALRGWSQSVRAQIAGLLDGGSVNKPSMQLFVVQDCSGLLATHYLASPETA